MGTKLKSSNARGVAPGGGGGGCARIDRYIRASTQCMEVVCPVWDSLKQLSHLPTELIMYSFSLSSILNKFIIMIIHIGSSSLLDNTELCQCHKVRCSSEKY